MVPTPTSCSLERARALAERIRDRGIDGLTADEKREGAGLRA